jgi:hypothetical protein
MPRPLSSRLMSIQSIPFSIFFLCVFAAILIILVGDPHYARLPGYEPVHLRRYWLVFYVKPWARLWSDRLFLASVVCLILFVLFQPFIRYCRKRDL